MSDGAKAVADAIKGDPNYNTLGHMKDDIVEVKGLIVQYKQAKDDIQEVIKRINPKDD